jgi:hypothetical protein
MGYQLIQEGRKEVRGGGGTGNPEKSGGVRVHAGFEEFTVVGG